MYFDINHEYHIVEFENISSTLLEYLISTFGKKSSTTWMIRGNSVYFYNEIDHTMCLLRFCNDN